MKPPECLPGPVWLMLSSAFYFFKVTVYSLIVVKVKFGVAED